MNMKIYLYTFLLLLTGCASDGRNSLKENRCLFTESYRSLGETLIIYQCEKEPLQSDCHIIRGNQCIYRVNRTFPNWAR